MGHPGEPPAPPWRAVSCHHPLSAAIVAASVTAVAPRSDILPGWLAIAGVPASVLILANPALPMAVTTLWFAAVTMRLIRGTGSATPATRHESPASA